MLFFYEFWLVVYKAGSGSLKLNGSGQIRNTYYNND